MRAACLLLLLVVIGTAQAQAQESRPLQPRPAQRLVDPEFGVASDGYALRREVQMLQWLPDAAGDRLEWRDAAMPSTGLAAAHRNPPALPFVAVEWQAPAQLPDGRAIAHETIAEAGAWRVLRPDPGLLPPNLAATFQPAGDVLTTAADPMSPQPGDLRLRWSELVLPPGTGFVETAAGWIRSGSAAGQARGATTVTAPAGDSTPRWPYWLAAIVLLAGVAAFAWYRHRQR